MATRRDLAGGDALPTPGDVSTFDYGELVAAQCAVAEHMAAAADFTDAFIALQPLDRAMVDRLETLASADPRVVGWVDAAVGRRHPARRRHGDFDAAESDLARAAVRSATYPTTEGGHGRRGPFAALTTTTPPGETHD